MTRARIGRTSSRRSGAPTRAVLAQTTRWPTERIAGNLAFDGPTPDPALGARYEKRLGRSRLSREL